MQIIVNWLKGSRNFQIGATLYKTFGTNQALKNLLEKGETKFCKDLLVEELQSLLEREEPVELPEDPDPDETRVMPDSPDDILQAIKNEWTPLYQRMNYLRHALDKDFDDMNSEAAIAYRKPIAFEILELEQQCEHIWAKRKYYLKEGKLPDVKENKLEVPEDPVQLANLINNTKKNIRRNRKLMNENPDMPKYTQLYISYKTFYKLITGDDYQEKD
jgi:hypothetical protein